LSLHHEINNLFSPAVIRQAQSLKPETVDALAVDEAVGALLLLKGNDAEQVRYVNAMNPQTAVSLCKWMSDATFWIVAGGITKQ